MPSHFEGARKNTPAYEEFDDLEMEEISDAEADRLAREGKARWGSTNNEDLLEEISLDQANQLSREGKGRWGSFEDLEDFSDEAQSTDDLMAHSPRIHDRAEGLRDAFRDKNDEEFSGKVRVVKEDEDRLRYLSAIARGHARMNNVAVNDNARHIDHLREDDVHSRVYDLEAAGLRSKAAREAEERRRREDKNRLRRAGHHTFMDRIRRRGDALEAQYTPEAIQAREDQRSVDDNDLLSGMSRKRQEAEDRDLDAFFERMSLRGERAASESEQKQTLEQVAAEFREVQGAYSNEALRVRETFSRDEFIRNAERAGAIKQEGDRLNQAKEDLVREAAEAAEKLRAEQRNAERKAVAARRSVFNLAALVLAGVMGRAATERQVQEFMRDNGVDITPIVEDNTRAIDRGFDRYAAPAVEGVADGVRGIARRMDRWTNRDEREAQARQQAAEAAEARALVNRFDQLFQRSERSGESYDERVERLKDAFSAPGAWEQLVAHRRELSIPAENELMMTLLALRDQAEDQVADLEESESDSRLIELDEAQQEASRYRRLAQQMGPEPVDYFQRDPTEAQLNRLANRE